MGLLQGRRQPAAGGPVQVGEGAVEVPLVLEPGCLGFGQQRDLRRHDGDAAGGPHADLVQGPGDRWVPAEHPTVPNVLLQQEAEHGGVGGELLGGGGPAGSAASPDLVEGRLDSVPVPPRQRLSGGRQAQVPAVQVPQQCLLVGGEDGDLQVGVGRVRAPNSRSSAQPPATHQGCR
jgi:hypothetical protein